VKKLLLLSFSVVVLLFGFQRPAETQTSSQNLILATDGRPGPIRPVAFHSNRADEKAKPVEEAELRAASARAIKRIQHAQGGWYKKETCTSCHHQLLPEIPLRLARERGVPVDEPVAQEATAAAFAFLKDLDAAVQGYDYIDVYSNGWSLVAARAAGVAANLTTAAYAQIIASHQRPDGCWLSIDVRPPQSYSPFTTTAICARAVHDYLPERLKDERETRMRRAREWLLKAQPRTTEDGAFQLLGLHWTGADVKACQKAARQLLAEQREDGGWSQLTGMVSDAYSTGEALFALRDGAGLAASDPAYQRGLRFLLKTQEADGSWHIKSRLHPPAPVSPPYFEAEFPYQHDQFISIMGSSWAAAALLQAMPAQTGTAAKPRVLSNLAPAAPAEWMAVSLTGSAADLKRLLDRGMPPDSKTAEGTTALMMAARDIEKVKLLVERGADVNARAATGITPLMAAAQYNGNVEVVRLLLKKGARPNADKPAAVRYDASALFYAVMARDVKMVEALVDAGASLNDRMKVIGRFSNSLLVYAASAGDTATVVYLISKGANLNEVDADGISILAWATISNRVDTVQALLARGAQVNTVDNYGMTPLLYAASINFGDTEVLEKLIVAGADLKAKNKQGLTAVDLAKTYHHTTMASLLTSKAAAR
jgi:ankyrin repeat protein